MMFKTWGYIVSKLSSFNSSPQPTLLRLWFKHWHLRPTLNSVIIWKVCKSAAFRLMSISDFILSCSQGHVLESGASSGVLFISLINVEATIGCGHCYRWNSAARCSGMDVHQYSVWQSLVYCYNTSDFYNSEMCSPTQKDGWVQVAIAIICLWLIKTTDSFALAQKYSALQVSS